MSENIKHQSCGNLLPNNLEQVPYEFYFEKYSHADPMKISRRLGIPFDSVNSEFQIAFLGRMYAVSYPALEIRSLYGRDIFNLNASGKFRILILRYFLYATVFDANGDFYSFRELPSGEVYAAAFDERCTGRLVKRYGKVLQVFEAVMESVDAVRIYGADIAYELEFLDGLFIRFLFWAGDDEFEPSAQILFSSNFPAAFSTYELAEIVDLCMDAFDQAEPVLAYANPYH